jgi:hypothetical protein
MNIRVVVGDIFEPPDLPLTIRFAHPPDEMQQAALEELLHAWFLIGQNRGFGPGFFHNAGSLVFEDDQAFWYVDIGSADSSALDVLKNCLEGYSEVHVPVQEILLGTKLDEQ